jgi:hypothetical protein
VKACNCRQCHSQVIGWSEEQRHAAQKRLQHIDVSL